jgi:NAD(P)H dehydrogenase (quinone)
MKIGVSGARGHLGRAVVSELLQRADGHEVVAITRTPEAESWAKTQDWNALLRSA